MLARKAQVSLGICINSPEPSLLDDAVSTKISLPIYMVLNRYLQFSSLVLSLQVIMIEI